MRRTLTLIAALALPLLLAASAAENLASAKSQISKSQPYSADKLLQEIINSSDASPAQVEEALVLQTMIYYGDVFGAALVLAPVSAATQKPTKYGAEVSRQLLLARRAFSVAGNSYLNQTFSSSALKKLSVELPALTDEDVKKIQAVLNDKDSVARLVADYDGDPAAGQGLLARSSQFGMYLGLGGLIPKSSGRSMTDVQSKFRGGTDFNQLAYLDWLASISLELHSLAKEPQANDPKFMQTLAKKCDERIKALTKDDAGNPYRKKAEGRAGKY
jgi:hypothetical protein